MASARDRHPENVSGDFFVDRTCIDCDTCRWMAPETFGDAGEQSVVHHQPRTAVELHRALQALVACPTASIGTLEKHALVPVLASFPIHIDGPRPCPTGAETAPAANPRTSDPPGPARADATGADRTNSDAASPSRGSVDDRADATVYHCGYHDESSFGATSYFVRRERGNLLVDSPRFAKQLVVRLEELGGVATLFLTHKDDVGDHAKWAAHFGCERVMHAADADRGTRAMERLVEGVDPIALDDDALLIPVPGHTRGSTCLLLGDTYLFTGDHLAWSEGLGQVYAFRDACWYDWPTQIQSMRRLAEHDFEWILPGHGRRCRFDRAGMRAQMANAIRWMES